MIHFRERVQRQRRTLFGVAFAALVLGAVLLAFGLKEHLGFKDFQIPQTVMREKHKELLEVHLLAITVLLPLIGLFSVSVALILLWHTRLLRSVHTELPPNT